ncbi:dihydroneopterin aldolase [Pseudidiomarina sp.]|uniref:dihydroneopterin aldolase n=1 Tax=Pseudidiomarina sp. TaxID=2081707 RepID=UPI00299D7727|nr:dihydroneopterin aldolase [Pseudidiomarina sp.]MDX1705973.1 dihydroneopterin aldolase [Pseudidiomarina sp.]
MDKVLVEGLQVNAFIGVHDWEHEREQPLVIDLEMDWDNARAARTNDLADALDYSTLSEAVVKLVQSQPWQLIETLAEAIAERILQDFNLPRLQVKIGKPQAIVAARQAAVVIVRQQTTA